MHKTLENESVRGGKDKFAQKEKKENNGRKPSLLSVFDSAVQHNTTTLETRMSVY